MQIAYLLQAVCYCLHLYVYSSKVLLYYFTVNSRDTIYALCQHVIYVSLPGILLLARSKEFTSKDLFASKDQFFFSVMS